MEKVDGELLEARNEKEDIWEEPAVEDDTRQNRQIASLGKQLGTVYGTPREGRNRGRQVSTQCQPVYHVKSIAKIQFELK